ncbi:MAG: hypothetical protein LBC82_09755 [Oscillospiraceae bacterium]|nr:hypothetical protein [Oscillospiraceae bacterium]
MYGTNFSPLIAVGRLESFDGFFKVTVTMPLYAHTMKRINRRRTIISRL